MHSQSPLGKKDYPKHAELNAGVLDSNSSLAWMAAMVGERKRVLDVGCATGYLAALLVKHECDVVGIDVNPSAAEEARRVCTRVLVADLDNVDLSELLAGSEFDAIVFGDVLEHLREPVRVLDQARTLLAENGFVIASIPNVSHGAIRLALLSGSFDYQELGILDDAHMRFFTAKSIDEAFVSAGYRIEETQRVTLPVFASSELIPALDPRDFDPSLVARVLADPESETLQYVVKAHPLSNDQRVRAISKRFLAANTELSNARRSVELREHELETVRAELATRAREAEQATQRALRAENEATATHERFRELERSYLTLESRQAVAEELRGANAELRAANAALQARLDAAFERLLTTHANYAGGLEEARRYAAQVEAELAKARASGEAGDVFARRLENELDAANKQIAQGERYAAEVEGELAKARAEAAASGDFVLHLRDELNATVREVADGKEYAAQVEAELAAARAEAVESAGFVRHLRDQLDAASEQIAEGKSYAQRVESELAAAHGAASDAATYARDLEKQLEHLGRLEREIEAIQVAALSERATSQAYLEDVRARAGALQAEYDAERARLEAALATSRDEIENLVNVRDVLHASGGEAERRAAESARRIAQLEEALASVRDDHHVLSAERDALGERVAQAQRELAASREEWTLYRTALAAAQGNLTAAQEELYAARDDLNMAHGELSEANVELNAKGDELRVKTDQLKAMSAELIVVNDDLTATSDDLSAAREDAATLRGDLETMQAEFAAAEDRLAVTLEELEAAQDDLAALQDQLVSTNELRQLERRELIQAGRRAAALERELEENRALLHDSSEALGVTRRVLAERQERLVILQIEADAALVRQRDYERLSAASAATLQARIEAQQSTVASLTASREELRTSLTDAEHRLIAQTENLVAETQAEAKQLATLIDVVQTSRFWGLKRWLNRFRGRSLKR